MPLVQFPDIPAVQGVPPLVRQNGAAILAVTGGLALLSELGLPTNFLAPQWGLFDKDGKAVLTTESFVGIRFHNSTPTSRYPVEKGGFVSYNKVGTPFEASITVSQGKDQQSREKILAQAQAALQSTDIYNLVTPDATYLNVSVESLDYQRTQRNGAGAVVLDIGLIEVRETAFAQYAVAGGSQNKPISSAAATSSSGASPESLGQVQSATPSADQLSLLAGIV